ncbi:MAG: (2Fe-2S)-binding protein [Planctomycetes bacterium]|nr:(2Fe-2S)-binding protein [Planctomycetota bacterium]
MTVKVDGKTLRVREGLPIAAELLAHGIKIHRYTTRFKEPRGIFCAVGRCTDCVMTVDGVPNVRTCITPVKQGMTIETQRGLGEWRIGQRDLGADGETGSDIAAWRHPNPKSEARNPKQIRMAK